MTPRIPTLLTTLAFAILLAAAPSALAATTPPGNSGVDQYTETYPTAAGGQGTGGGHGGSPSQTLGHQTARQFAEAGPAGQAAADLAAKTAPPAAERRAPDSGAADSGDSGSGGSQGPLGALEHAVGSSDEGGMGVLLPMALAATLLAGLAFLVARRRRVS